MRALTFNNLYFINLLYYNKYYMLNVAIVTLIVLNIHLIVFISRTYKFSKLLYKLKKYLIFILR